MMLVKNKSVRWNSCNINLGSFQLCTVYMKEVESWLIPNFTDGETDIGKPFSFNKWEFHICLSGLNSMVVVNLPITSNSLVLDSSMFEMILPWCYKVIFLKQKHNRFKLAK